LHLKRIGGIRGVGMVKSGPFFVRWERKVLKFKVYCYWACGPMTMSKEGIKEPKEVKTNFQKRMGEKIKKKDQIIGT
jgi:hypothetical protein